ncbi:protein-tyrosine-phosphatase [Galbibacter sp. BG1]|uniref:arsenate-mycothiol transferase ArsC n=1 Tax=Galbibacter sp. BG1 TaxID=1170699 RepID=UPI0015C164F4|nr:protein-tyrosine-phosphatase [Galbibacter sp. BG1]QLE02631.1 protein-tyrosine-phosphatase [Galbibacter sp. BG1]
MYANISKLIEVIDLASITEERKKTLQPLVDFIKIKLSKNEDVAINFICTHNSRRSHFSQIWAQTMAHHFQISNFSCYSGGTESTALYEQVAKTLVQDGFLVEKLSEGTNPVYAIKFDENAPAIIGFSKKFDHHFNPSSHFAAIMTCSQADEGCPFIAGAEKRIPITYEDPKLFDGTPEAAAMYTQRSHQIATEMFYIFSKVAK